MGIYQICSCTTETLYWDPERLAFTRYHCSSKSKYQTCIPCARWGLFLMNFPPPTQHLLYRNFFPSISPLKLCTPEVRTKGQSSYQPLLPSYTEELSCHMVPFLFMRHWHIWFHRLVPSEFWTTVIPLPMNCPKIFSSLVGYLLFPHPQKASRLCPVARSSLVYPTQSSSSLHKSFSFPFPHFF